ncbi:hypothetical protein BU26DRAFT_135046 [Trematosphaeria pertusa]|uniref:Uncharacterized protein n=1 Tax=Trematosphaeria pertusa TaxID=390896 RepID=A0A6A6IUX0_9PLEO|nr:uncharacterized protein BU26DRAFT_135046 [Trematosphaeria pertusa]KAF2254219.1 hypothetical protein BU26DRAFT_135046 [Trematosphaeria pertusa]
MNTRSWCGSKKLSPGDMDSLPDVAPGLVFSQDYVDHICSFFVRNSVPLIHHFSILAYSLLGVAMFVWIYLRRALIKWHGRIW